MSTDPIFSKGALKALGILLVALVLGGGAYALAGGGIGIDLPDIDLPETTTGDNSATQLSNTTLESTTIDGPAPEEPAADPFTSATFATAIDKVRAETGPGMKLTRLFINDVQTQFIVQKGEQVDAYSVRADNGEVTRQEATITVSGNATIDDFAFALDAIEPAAVDRMLAKAAKLSHTPDFQPTVLNLERDLSAGLKPPEWTISAEGGNRNLTFKASEDGREVRNVGGEGSEIPQAALDARKLNECIQSANQDFDAIQKCFENF